MTTPEPTMPKPDIPISPGTEEWWEAAGRGVLLLQRCDECGHTQHYPRSMCVSCWSESTSWIESTGEGSVWTFTVAHVPGHPAWLPEVPYVIAIIELDEGPRILSNVIDTEPSQLVVGQRVRMAPPSSRTDQRVIQFVRAE